MTIAKPNMNSYKNKNHDNNINNISNNNSYNKTTLKKFGCDLIVISLVCIKYLCVEYSIERLKRKSKKFGFSKKIDLTILVI